MNQKQLLTLFIFLNLSVIISAQSISENQLLKIENHPTDSTKFIAKLYNSQTRRLEEYWEMISVNPEFNMSDYNKLIDSSLIIPHGKCYFLYPNRAKKLELNYDYGSKVGEIKGYYETGELRFTGNYKINLGGKLTHYYKDGSIKNEDFFIDGFCNGKSITYFPSGNIQMETNYSSDLTIGDQAIYFSFGVKDGKQIIFHPNGIRKRELKYKTGKLISEKCFDTNGAKTECNPLITKPIILKGKNQFLTDLQNFTFNNDSTLNDTLLLGINLKIDTTGCAKLQDYDFGGQDSLQTDLINWLEKPGIFSPMLFDDQPVECNIELKVPVYQNKILLLDDFNESENSSRNETTLDEESTYTWNFSPIDDITFLIVEQMPKFPGGEFAMRSFIAKNIRYPAEAQEKGIQGKVYVNFVIDKKGQPIKISIAKGVHHLIDNEAMRVISMMPTWRPGMQRGKNVNVSFTVPINFELSPHMGKIIIE
jgi:TonB family protein